MINPTLYIIDRIAWLFGLSTLAGLLGSSAYAVFG